MDTFRATKYLIFALLGVCIVFGISIILDKNHSNNAFTSDALENLEKIMVKKSINLNTNLSNKRGNYPVLQGVYYKKDDEIFQKLKSNYDIEKSNEANITVNIKLETTDFSEEKITDFANNFLKDNFPSKKFAKIYFLKEVDGFVVRYSQIENNLILSESVAEFKIKNSGEAVIKILPIKIEEQTNPVEVISDAEAISPLLNSLDSQEIIYFELLYKSQNTGDQIGQTERISLFPTYEIRTKSGKVFNQVAINS